MLIVENSKNCFIERNLMFTWVDDPSLTKSFSKKIFVCFFSLFSENNSFPGAL